MKTLYLTIMKTYFDEILQGTKKEELRLASPYWRKRLQHEADHRRPLSYTHVQLCNGYSSDRPCITVELEDIELMSLPVGQGRKEKFFVLFLGKLVKSQNLKPEQKRLLRQRL